MGENISISSNFPGGNITILRICGDVVYLKPDMRGDEPWCHWAFRVDGAAGRTMTFLFETDDDYTNYSCHTRCEGCRAADGKDFLGYFGPAVSDDLIHWRWASEGLLDTCEKRCRFTYEFSESEDRVYFAHCMLYGFERFQALDFLKHGTLCMDRGGIPVPCAEYGDGEDVILLTARHHAAEAPANYVLEGVLRELAAILPDRYRLIAVPFVDAAGVWRGDQGKGRLPHDHNRDYIADGIYPSTAKIKELLHEKNIVYVFDFHSPCHLGGGSDLMSLANSYEKNIPKARLFSKLFANEMTDTCFQYTEGTISYGGKTPTVGTLQTYAGAMDRNRYVVTLESPYFGTPENPMSDERYVETGRAFARAMVQLIAQQE